jgi:hypothetical protein
MHGEEWRVCLCSVEDGRGIAPCLRVFGVVGVEKLGQEGDAFRIVHGSEVGTAADVDDRLDTARVIRERVVRVIACIFHPEQRGELPTGGVAEGSDLIGIDVVLCRVGAYPAHGTLHVVELSRP